MLAACGAPPAEPDPTPTTPPPGPTLATCPDTIVIEDFLYSPDACQVAVGTTLTFVNRDLQPHTATSLEGAAAAFDTGTLEQGETEQITFTQPGDYPYYCTVHPDMRASITVK